MKTKIRFWMPAILFALSSVFFTNCKEDATIPVVSTNEATAVTNTTATSGGVISADGGATVTARGVCWSTSQTPTITDNITSDGTGAGSFTSAISGLTANTTYYVRAYATNSAGTGYGSAMSFKTLEGNIETPVVSTNAITAVTDITATSGGVISSDGGATVTARGVCWSTSQTPTIADNKTSNGTGTGSFTSAISGLTANTTYYVRAYATNSAGTGYGSAMSFTTLDIVFNPNITYGTMTDIDGNTYKTVTIGTQTWMAENLKVTKYNDGTAIPNVTDETAWSKLTTGAYCNYDNDPSKVAMYGRLYNWHAVKTGKLCPTGWHVPTSAELETLGEYLGGYEVAGDKLKETGTTHWQSPNEGATNTSGFTALPGGYRNIYGTFYGIGVYGYWWSSTEYVTSRVGHWLLGCSSGRMDYDLGYKVDGFSVRCVRD